VTPVPLVIAHRGASGYRPEHTRAAYELAFEQGADAVEPDIVATKDRILVLRHENEISRTTDVAAHPQFASRRATKVIDGQELTGWFTEDFTWAELSTLRAMERLPEIRTANVRYAGEQGILRLTDLLDLLDATDRRVGMVAEIKHATYFESIGLPLDELFANELSAVGWGSDSRLTIECFEKTVLTKIRERGVLGNLVFLMEASGAPADQVAAHGTDALRYSDYLSRDGLQELATSVDGISLDKHILLEQGGADVVSRAHGAGLSVFCWTLRAENEFLPDGLRRGSVGGDLGDWQSEFQTLMRMGVDGVFADQPDLAIEVRDRL
jgi:glycerophosphoryl diester phosphodiesterase